MKYYIQNDVIIDVKYAKHLGVIIYHCIWNEHINYITSKANNIKLFSSAELQYKPH